MVTHSGSTITLGAVYPLIDDNLTVVVYDMPSCDKDPESYIISDGETPIARCYPSGEIVSSILREELMDMFVEEISITDLMEANTAQCVAVYVSRKDGGKE